MEATEYELMFRQEDSHWWYRALHRVIRAALDSHVSGWRDRPILDAGCGTGAVLAHLGNRKKHVGIDRAPEAIAYCRRRGLHTVARADVNALPFEDNSFDAVISSSVLYHQWVTNVDRATQELRRVLRPGGVLLVNVAAYEFLRSPHDDAVFTARRFTRSEVRHMLSANGLRVRRLTSWTTLLFPLAVVARSLGGSRTGRDFDAGGPSATANRLLGAVMTLEFALMRRVPLPFGVAIFAVAEKHDGPRD